MGNLILSKKLILGKGRVLTRIYLITETQISKKDFTRQIRRASISIFKYHERFGEILTKSLFFYMLQKPLEKFVLNYIAFDLNYITRKLKTFKVTEISKLLSGFIKYLNHHKV
jgi:hypothetical protein